MISKHAIPKKDSMLTYSQEKFTFRQYTTNTQKSQPNSSLKADFLCAFSFCPFLIIQDHCAHDLQAINHHEGILDHLILGPSYTPLILRNGADGQ